MKKYVLFILCATSLIACKKKGEDGNVYFEIEEDVYNITAYTDDNADVPTNASPGYSYQTHEGDYSYDYTLSNGYHYAGSYELGVNEGSKGGFFIPGAAGADRYYTLVCSGSGGQLTYFKNEMPVYNIDTFYQFEGYAMHVKATGVYDPSYVIDNPKYKGK